MPNEYSTRLANLVNLVAADDRLAPVQLGGWSAWGNQLHRSTFLPPLVINHLHVTGNDLLIMISKVCNDLMYVGGALDVLDEIEGHVDGVKATPTNEVRWLGLEDNPYYYPILFDDSEIFATIFERGDRRDFQSVHRYAGGIWALPVTELLASWGSICGDQPAVGTLALSLSESTEQFVLVRRTWTPTETIADVLDVFPATADQSELLAVVRAAVGSLTVPEIEWFEFHAKDALTREAVIAGLKDVAGASDADLMQIGRVISARNFDPPTRLDLAEPKRFPTAPAGDPLKVWFYAVTQPRVIDKTARAAFGLWRQPA